MKTCQCGEITGTACQPSKRRITIEWMPLHLRASHVKARNRGVYPHNGAMRLLVNPGCAAELIAQDPEWTSQVTS